MKKLLPILLLALVSISESGCAAWKEGRWLAAHEKELNRLASSKLSAEQKLDGLIQDYIKFMNEDLKFINPVKGVKYVKKYHKRTRASMDKILSASASWQGSLSTVDKIALGVRTVQKPYIKDLVDLVPKFKRKYKQYAFALEMAGKIVGGLTKFAGKDLF